MNKFKVLTFAVSIIILSLIILYANPMELVKAVNSANKTYILFAIGFSTLAVLFRVLKWKILVGIPYKDVFPIQLVGITISNFTPGHIAEPIKSVLLKSLHKIPVSKSLPSVIWERAMDILVLLLMSFIALNFFALTGDALILSYAGIAVFSILFLFALLVLTSQKFGELIFRIIRKIPFLKGISNDFLKTFYENKFKKSLMIKSFLITILPWLADSAAFLMILTAFGVEVNPLIVIGLVSIPTIIGVASSLPGGLGSMEGVMIVLLTPFVPEIAVAAAIALVFRFSTFWYGTFIGGLSFVYLSNKTGTNIFKME